MRTGRSSMFPVFYHSLHRYYWNHAYSNSKIYHVNCYGFVMKGVAFLLVFVFYVVRSAIRILDKFVHTLCSILHPCLQLSTFTIPRDSDNYPYSLLKHTH